MTRRDWIAAIVTVAVVTLLILLLSAGFNGAFGGRVGAVSHRPPILAAGGCLGAALGLLLQPKMRSILY